METLLGRKATPKGLAAGIGSFAMLCPSYEPDATARIPPWRSCHIRSGQRLRLRRAGHDGSRFSRVDGRTRPMALT